MGTMETQPVWSENEPRANAVARGLGWFSIGLGLTELIAPDAIAAMVGVRKHRRLIRSYGLREIAAGVGILTSARPAVWLQSRVAGDIIDLASLGAAAGSARNGGRAKAAFGLAAVAGVTAVDVWCAGKLTEDVARPGHGSRAEASVIIDRSREQCYAFWRDLEKLPRVMNYVESVKITGERTSHWVVNSPNGALEWDAELVTDRPNEEIAWRTLPGSDVQHSGSVEFQRAGGDRGTIVRVAIEFGNPVSAIGSAIAGLIGKNPEQVSLKELRRFKQAIETGEVIKTDGQPAGRRGSVTWLDEIAR